MLWYCFAGPSPVPLISWVYLLRGRQIGDACSKQQWRSACSTEFALELQMSTVVEAAKKPMPIKKAQKTVKKAASKAKSQVKGGASGADFWYGPNRPGFLGELRARSMVESHFHPTG